MAMISDLLSAGPTLSFEFFPPKTPAGLRGLQRTLDTLQTLRPSFISVTYGAGGSTRETTRDLVVEANAKRPFPAMAHLTCVSHSVADLTELLADYSSHGVSNLLALAGDPPADGAIVGDLKYASELVELIRASGDFSIGVAAQPELHHRSTDRQTDRRFLAAKLNMADFGVTDFFFTASDYVQMVNELADLGCDRPILPGIMPVTNPASIKRFAEMSKIARPPKMWEHLESLQDDPDALLDAATDYACELIEQLQAAGCPGVHIYALNKPEASMAICERLGLTG